MNRSKQAGIWIAILLVAAALLYLVNDILLPFLVGIAIAYFLDPLVKRSQKAGCPRVWATTIVTLVFFALVVALLILIVPLAYGQFLAFLEQVPTLVRKFNDWLQPFIADIRRIIPVERFENVENAGKDAIATLAVALGRVAQGIWAGGLALFNLLSLILITPVVAFYLLRDWDLIVGKVDSWLPRDFADTIRGVMREIDTTISGFVRGTGTVVLFLAAVYAGGLTLVGLNFGLVVGLMAGFLSFIPYVGTFSGLVVALIIAIVQWGDVVHVVLVLAVFGFGQVIESFYLTPKLVGEKVGLHPVWVIFALMAGGLLMGFTGVILAVPVAATIGVLTRFFLGRYLASPLYGGAVAVVPAGDDGEQPQ